MDLKSAIQRRHRKEKDILIPLIIFHCRSESTTPFTDHDNVIDLFKKNMKHFERRLQSNSKMLVTKAEKELRNADYM